MNNFDSGQLRELFEHLGIKPVYLMPSLAAWQLQASNAQKDLPVAFSVSVERLRDLATTSKDFLQIGVFEFFVGLDFLQAERSRDAVEHFDLARRQWIFIDHLPLIALAHMGAGMAHQGAGEFRQAMAAYFKVKQCLQEAGREPYRLEKIEKNRSLQAFWNDLERLLRQAVASLQREFDSQQEDRLQSELGDDANPGDEQDSGNGTDPATDSGSQTAADKGNGIGVLTFSMQPGRTISAADVNELLYRTVAEIEVLNVALSHPGESGIRLGPEVARITFAGQGDLTVELVNVSQHVKLFCRWLTAIVSPRSTLNDASQDRADSSQTWFRLQVESGRVANLVRAYVKSVTRREPGAHEIERLMQAVVHLAELRTNFQLTLG